MDNNLAFSPATEVGRLIVEREVSPVELAGLFLERIDALDGKLNSYLAVTADRALADARAAEDAVMRGDELGPLHGVPISVKDLEMSAGVRTTGGSLVFEDRVPHGGLGGRRAGEGGGRGHAGQDEHS